MSGWPSGRWAGQVRAGSSWTQLFAQYGTIYLDAGWLTFIRDGESTPAWQVPVPTITASQYTVFANSSLRLSSPTTGELKVTVSQERINRFSRNDFKTLRQRRYAGEFLQLLAQSGARV
jgi:hypothetical protein